MTKISNRQNALWENAVVATLAAHDKYLSPIAAAKEAILYADALVDEIIAQEQEETRELREAEEAEINEVRARFPLGSWAKCYWGTAPVVKVEKGSLHYSGKITVSIFHEGRNSGTGITLPHTEFTPVAKKEEKDD